MMTPASPSPPHRSGADGGGDGDGGGNRGDGSCGTGCGGCGSDSGANAAWTWSLLLLLLGICCARLSSRKARPRHKQRFVVAEAVNDHVSKVVLPEWTNMNTKSSDWRAWSYELWD